MKRLRNLSSLDIANLISTCFVPETKLSIRSPYIIEGIKIAQRGKCLIEPIALCTYKCQAGGGGGGGRRGIGRGFDICQENAVKFPTPGQKCEVKYNWNLPPWEMICGHGHEQKFKYPYTWDSKIIQMPYPGPKQSIKIPPYAPLPCRLDIDRCISFTLSDVSLDENLHSCKNQ